MAYEEILYDVEDNVATITLHRPDKLNAFTNRMLKEIIAAFDEVDADDNVRAVIVTGSGRAFCAGADLSGGGETFAKGGSDVAAKTGVVRDGGGLVALRIFESTKPVIGAINGAAVGVGVTMTLPMDIRLASDTSKFGFVFARRGIVPEAASSWFLPRIVGSQGWWTDSQRAQQRRTSRRCSKHRSGDCRQCSTCVGGAHSADAVENARSTPSDGGTSCRLPGDQFSGGERRCPRRSDVVPGEAVTRVPRKGR